MMRPTAPATALSDHDTGASPAWYRKRVEKGAPTLPNAVLDHLDALYRVAHGFTGRDGDAEDLVQETYARAISAWSQFVPGTNLRAWLFRILRNAYIDSYRRARANPVRTGFDDELAAHGAAPLREPVRGDAELEALRNIVATDIERALALLTVDARAIVLLDLEGFTETELAEALGCAVGTVKSRLARARAVLREHLRDYGG